jgi:glycosyltransferase involved in cell wall biosynthesis
MVGPIWDVDFTLAIYNRSGKYFIGRVLLTALAPRFGRVFYWRLALAAPPSGIWSRIIGKADAVEFRLRKTPVGAALPRHRSKRPVLHLDPSSVLGADLRPTDIVLCHDLGPITHPALFAPDVENLYVRALGVIARVQPRLVFVSRASYDAYTRLYGAPRDGRVIYPPIRGEIAKPASSAMGPISGPFLLTVGAIGMRKNQARLIAAFGRSGLQARGMKLVLCGAREPGSEVVVQSARDTPGVVLLDYVSDGDLAWLYEKAIGFVLPSLLEGFGLPVAEAVRRGLLPLVTADSVLEEVAGPSALLVDPTDEEQLARKLTELSAMDPAERQRRVSEAQAWGSRFSMANFTADWERLLDS